MKHYKLSMNIIKFFRFKKFNEHSLIMKNLLIIIIISIIMKTIVYYKDKVNIIKYKIAYHRSAYTFLRVESLGILANSHFSDDVIVNKIIKEDKLKLQKLAASYYHLEMIKKYEYELTHIFHRIEDDPTPPRFANPDVYVFEENDFSIP